VRLPLAGEGAHLQRCGNLKVGEAEGWLEWYGGEPGPAELGASTPALACSGLSDPSSASLFPAKISWQRWCWVVSWVLAGRVPGVRMGARVVSAASDAAG
jgi:hypothetical protein